MEKNKKKKLPAATTRGASCIDPLTSIITQYRVSALWWLMQAASRSVQEILSPGLNASL